MNVLSNYKTTLEGYDPEKGHCRAEIYLRATSLSALVEVLERDYSNWTVAAIELHYLPVSDTLVQQAKKREEEREQATLEEEKS